MSKWCRYVKTLQVYFVKMVQVQKNCDGRRTRPHHHLSHTTNASLIIERSKCTIKQSEDWLMPTVNPNVYLRDGTSLVNLLHLLCPLFSFVLLRLLANNLLRLFENYPPNIERNERLMAQKEIVTMTMPSFVAYLRIDPSLMNSLCLLCPLYSFVLLLSLLRILVKISV